MADKYTLATNVQGTQVFIPVDGGPLVFREYTRQEAEQVADWLNGKDQPLQAINVADYPGTGYAPRNYVRTELLEPYGLTDH